MSYNFDCNICRNKCDGVSKGVYDFMNDVEFSEHFEKQLIDKINKMGYFAIKTDKPQYPDIEVYTQYNGRLVCYIEVKAQRRTFMSVTKLLPQSNLTPSVTLALNQSDLEHYIDQSHKERVPIYIVWVLSNRPCIVPPNETKLFYNHISVLERIFYYYRDKRRFRRKSGAGDVINGQHKGVVVNYHFSLDELLPFDLKDIL